MIRGYLDQSILGHVRDGRLHLHRAKDVHWVYSNEHFAEISRGNDRSFLGVLRDLRAQRIEFNMDDRFQACEGAYLHEYRCPFDDYEDYLQALRTAPYDTSILTDVFSHTLGADNLDLIQDLPAKIMESFESLGIASEELFRMAPDFENTLDSLRDALSKRPSLLNIRCSMGTKDKSWNLNSDNPLAEVWETVKEKCPDLSSDQFFGFRSLDDDPAIPLHFGIIRCCAVLNLLGFRPDKPSSARNIQSDAIHIAHALYSDAFLTADVRQKDKGRAIFKYLGMGPEIFLYEAERSAPVRDE